MIAVVRNLVFIALICVFPSSLSGQDYTSLFRNFDARALTPDDKRFLQTALAFSGHYKGLLDGDWGSLSQSALEKYAMAEFDEHAQTYHMVILAFDFVDRYQKDGWQMEHFSELGLSMMVPLQTVSVNATRGGMANWNHEGSSLAYTAGRQNRSSAERFHDYTLSKHEIGAEPYVVRRTNYAISRAVSRDGSVLYARSNWINGGWSTVMLSARARDTAILDAVASSITLGYARPIMFTEGGQIAYAVEQVAALAEQEREAPVTPTTPRTSKPSSTTSQASGSGFIVSSNGHVLTNAHVTEGCSRYSVDGARATLVASSETFDLAVLKTAPDRNRTVAQFARTPARLNSDVTAIGYPYAGLLGGVNVTRGSVSSLKGLMGDETRFQISAPVQSGNSGGPLLSSSGYVVGVVVAKLDAGAVEDAIGDLPQNVNFAIRGEIAKLFLFQNGVTPVENDVARDLSGEALAELARGFTTHIECN